MEGPDRSIKEWRWYMQAEQLETRLDSLLDEAKAKGRCTDWEIDELVPMGGKELGLKIGIYPWGKTILYGTAHDLFNAVNEILGEIARKRFKCPFCSAVQPLDATVRPQAECACGAKFFVRHGWTSGQGISGEDCWPALRWALLHSGHGSHHAEAARAVGLVEDGAALEDVFDGAVTLTVLGTVVHAIRPDARPADVPLRFKLADLLLQDGFQENVSRSFDYGEWHEHRWYEGEVSGEPVVVALGANDHEPTLTLAIDEEEPRIYAGAGKDDDLRDEITEAWSDWWTAETLHAGWAVSEDELSGRWYSLSAIYEGPTVDDPDAAWLRRTLEDGVEACVGSARRFVEHFDPEGRARELASSRERAQFVHEQALRDRLTRSVPEGSGVSAALALYLDALGSAEPKGWLDKDVVEIAVSSVEDKMGRTGAANFVRSKAASLLWSKKLRKYLAHTWGERA
jgi:hypothetical protein